MNSGLTFRKSAIAVGYDGRPLPWAEDHDTGQVVAFVFGRRTNSTFRRLLQLSTTAGLIVTRWLQTTGGLIMMNYRLRFTKLEKIKPKVSSGNI